MQETNVNIVEEMQTAYLDYSMAVLVGRAIPDLYDGLKPVTRRVLTAMKWLNLRPDGRYMKAARVSGETMGKLHPHGGAYGAMVTASQPWTNGHPLIDGHGNWGSPTDGPAAERYTEARLTAYSFEALLQDTDTWVTRDNYDGSFQEPIQFNAKLPNLLLNGGEGIGVGFATKVPTHNLRGVAKALQCVIEDDARTAAKHLIPDFPTGCEVVKDAGLLEYMSEGRGSIRMRAVCEIDSEAYGKRSKRDTLTFTNLPMHVNTEQVGEQIKTALENGKITTVADVRDETDMTGVRFVVILRANADVELAKAECYKWTSLDTKFGANNLAIDGTKPVQLSPFHILKRWLEWRDGRLVACFAAELDGRRKRLEILQGLTSALTMIDEIIDEIRRSKDKADARVRLMKRDFTENQANAILDMRLSQLTKLDDKALRDEAKEVQARIKELIKLNSKKDLRTQYILEEVDALAIRHGNARRSKVVAEPQDKEVTVVKQGRKTVKVEGKPRFVKVDEKTGILTQLRKMQRGSWVVQDSEKLAFMCSDGKFYKTSSRHKGGLSDGPVQILYRTKSDSMGETPITLVWKIDDAVFANVVTPETLFKTTSKGKRYIPEGAELLHLGGSYTVPMQGRKKDKQLDHTTLKVRPVGGKGTKIANLTDTTL